MESENDQIIQRQAKLEEIKKNHNPYPYTYQTTAECSTLQEKYAHLEKEVQTKDKYAIAGRIMLLRRMGKVTFVQIQDTSGKMQLYFKEENIPTQYPLLKQLDLGDHIGAKGNIFKTKTGEITLSVENFEVLAKALRPLPEKFHGLQDPELRYRMRYLDLISNPEVKQIFVTRSRILKEIRNYLDGKGFMEVETPTLQPLYGGANARPFTTHHHALDMNLYLRISPELYLKRLIIGGFEKVYDLSKNFRNEGIDHTHNPEFTMLECYQAYADYHTMMELCKDLIMTLAKKIHGSLTLKVQNTTIDLGTWQTITMHEAIKKYAQLDPEKLTDLEIITLLSKEKVEIKQKARGVLINLLFETFVESKLINPTFVIDYPKEVSPLTKDHREKKGLTERFELFINGKEFANAYSELNDPIEQRKRLKEQESLRSVDGEAHPMDEEFVQAMEYGMPPTGGIGIGVDRLVMLLLGIESIREVILFPTMRKKED